MSLDLASVRRTRQALGKGFAITERLRLCLMGVTLKARPAIGNATTTLRWALEPRGNTLPKSTKHSEAVRPKSRDPSWKIRHALGHKVELTKDDLG